MQLGTAEVVAAANISVTGVLGTMQLGTATATGAANVNVIGVEGIGEVGNNIFTLVWGEIDTSQTPDWVKIAA